MVHLIDKSALVAEIDKRLHQLTDAAFDSMIGRNLIEIKDFLDTLEVKEVQEEPVIKDLWESSKRYALLQVLASTDAKMTEQAYLSLKLFSGFEIAVAHKDGAKWQNEQIIKRLCNHAYIDQMVEKFEDKYKPEKVLDTEYYKRGIFDTIKTIKED